MGENIYKSYDEEGVNIQNILRGHTTQKSTNKSNPIKTWEEDLIDIFPKKTHRWPTGT